jgi:hypothetical protein
MKIYHHHRDLRGPQPSPESVNRVSAVKVTLVLTLSGLNGRDKHTGDNLSVE